MRTLNYIFFFVSISFFSCEDKCEYYRTYTIQRPLYETRKTIRDTVDYVESREINNPGKLNYKDGFIFISEIGKGIHVVDNRNINNPENIGFIILPGNYDIATKDNYLYADSYLDLVVFDVSNLTSISEVNRVEGVFENYYINQGLYSEELGIVVGFDEEVVEELIENYDCELAYD